MGRVLENRKVCVAACLLPVLLLALVLDKAADVVGLLGGFFSTLLMSALPSIIFYAGIGNLYYRPFTRSLLMVFLLGVTCVGAFSSVIIILQTFNVCCQVPPSVLH